MKTKKAYVNRHNGIPWGIIVLLVFFCWPLGLYLVYRKAQKNKTAALKNSTWLKVIGWFWFALGFFSLLSIVEEPSDIYWPAAIFILAVFLGGGIVMIVTAKKLKKQGLLYKRYIDIIVNDEKYKIKEIAEILQVDREQVIRTLKQMIELGFFVNAKLDLERYEIIIRKKGEPLEIEKTLQNATIVECKCCGAKNVVPLGSIQPCEYCDTFLAGK